jgi:hypothetical protein
MTAWKALVARHILAFIISLVIMMILSLSFIFIQPAFLYGPESPGFFCCVWTGVWFSFVLIPISSVGESLMAKRLRWNWLIQTPIVGIIVLASNLVLLFLLGLVILGVEPPRLTNSDLAPALVVFYSVWGIVYWATFRILDKPLSRTLR